MSNKKEDLDFIQTASIICGQHGCTLDSVDGRTINIICPGGKEQEAKCAKAIERFVKGVDPKVEVSDGPICGCDGNCDQCGH